MSIISFDIADADGNKYTRHSGFGVVNTLDEIKTSALMADEVGTINLGLPKNKKTEDNVELVLNGGVLKSDLVAGRNIKHEDTIVARSAIQKAGAKKHKRKVWKKTNKKLRISKSHNRKSSNRKKRKHKTRKHKTRKHKARKRY